VPGAKGSYVRISDAVKAGRPGEAPYPAAIVGPSGGKAEAPAAAGE
jgi:hypothetical protein